MARLRTTVLCEAVPQLDIRDWYRKGWFEAESEQVVAWGEQILQVQIRRAAVGIRLSGQLRWIPVTWSSCGFGGQRPWFTCLNFRNGKPCQRRAAILYFDGKSFACRRCCCAGLAYASQAEGRTARAIRKARKLRMRLEGGPALVEFPPKPKYMRWPTYRTLQKKYDDAIAVANEPLVPIVNRCLRGPLARAPDRKNLSGLKRDRR
jgi:hypothetical protein